MLKEIPQKINHTITGFEEIKPVNPENPILYKPVYKRVFALDGVYWDKSRNERIYLYTDTQGYTCEGKVVSINANNLELLNDIADIEMFWSILAHNGYKIQDGKLEFHPNPGSVYMTDKGIIVIYLTDGCHTCINRIVDYTLVRLADIFETEWFFTNLNINGFTYHPVNKCITESERYYYFPSYSLYNGFQPERKKWINSDADKFYEKHHETFDTFYDCANWCNIINKALQRDYPEIN